MLVLITFISIKLWPLFYANSKTYSYCENHQTKNESGFVKKITNSLNPIKWALPECVTLVADLATQGNPDGKPVLIENYLFVGSLNNHTLLIHSNTG